MKDTPKEIHIIDGQKYILVKDEILSSPILAIEEISTKGDWKKSLWCKKQRNWIQIENFPHNQYEYYYDKYGNQPLYRVKK